MKLRLTLCITNHIDTAKIKMFSDSKAALQHLEIAKRLVLKLANGTKEIESTDLDAILTDINESIDFGE